MKHKSICLLSLFPILLSGCNGVAPYSDTFKYGYGVFLGITEKDLSFAKDYETVVLDMQYYEQSDIQALKDNNQIVLSYLNIGSIEIFRPYYEAFKDITFGKYENWDGEFWIDVSKPAWQYFVVDVLAKDMIDKGADGFYVDNADVYYEYRKDEIFDGLTNILTRLQSLNTYVMINGGDTYVDEYLNRYSNLNIMDAVNQETVFTAINFKTNKTSRSKKEDREYFQEYVETVNAQNKDVYLLEYTKRKAIIKDIDAYCKEKGFKYYASKTIELLKP